MASEDPSSSAHTLTPLDSIPETPTECAITAEPVMVSPTSSSPGHLPPSRSAGVATCPDSVPLSPATTDRVFPIRSVVSGRGGDQMSQDSSRKSSLGGPPDPPKQMPSFYTKRHEHIETEEGHMVITGLTGAETMQKCEDEPIHIPGAVQSFGCLVALKELEDGTSLDVRVASENTQDILGYSPCELFERENFCSILSEEQMDVLFDHIDFVREDTDLTVDGPEVFSIMVRGPDGVEFRCWCALHIPEGNPELLILEFELEEDAKNPLIHMSDEGSCTPEDTLASEPTTEEFAQSTTSMSKPLRVLRHARRRCGESAAMEVFNLMSQVQEQLASATSLDDLLRVVCGLVKELSGFHRVMIYKFDESWDGLVVAELVDARATKDLFKGLQFPATDIPAQARELYRINKVRLLYDRDQTTARLVCKTEKDLKVPLDLKHSCLRAMSPIHIKYLRNMAVRASMSISITAFGQLWGLISCHTYGQKGMRVSFPIRKMCRLIGETASRNIERLNYTRRLHARKLINTVPTEQNPGGYIVASSDDLLRLFDADAGLLSIRDETKVLGKLEETQEALAMLEYLRMRRFTSVITSEDLAKDFPDLRYEPGFKSFAGLLLVPLSMGCDDFIVFLRQPELRNVHWAGNPYEKVMREGTAAYLEPRKSFKIWSETVVGRSREWTEEQIETAAVLCLVYGKFIEVWRQKEAALKNSQLTKLLLANASHEVRTPLNAIINYLEIALEGPLDKETRDNLARSHSASKSLIYVINDLLDLTRTEGGNLLVQDEVFDLRKTISDATEMFKADAGRKGVAFEIVEYPGLPERVIGDTSRVRQIITNITGNAVRHTKEGGIKIEVWVSSLEGDDCQVEIAVQDTGEGMPPSKLDALFREFEQCHLDEDHSGDAEDDRAFPDMPGQRILGLGLAVVARIIRNMNGQLRLKSEEGKGSRFTVSIPFKVSQQGGELSPQIPDDSAIGASPRETPLSPTQQEVTLVHGSLSRRASNDTLGRTSSAGSHRSTRSGSSGQSEHSAKSTIDRMVHALSSQRIDSGSPLLERSRSSTSIISPKLTAGSRQTVAPRSVSPIVAQAVLEVSLPNDQKSIPVPSGAVVPRNPPRVTPAVHPPGGKFSVLVAEDDPINSKIIKKRLERMGHDVVLTANGKECFEEFGLRGSKRFDAVLMDMQMPIMDGGTSASCIRQHEKRKRPGHRIPIFAVSASLVEHRKKEYCKLGFDGWILKPVDFRRLAMLLEGSRNETVRREARYIPGNWESGGWFHSSPAEAQ